MLTNIGIPLYTNTHSPLYPSITVLAISFENTDDWCSGFSGKAARVLLLLLLHCVFSNIRKFSSISHSP